jgi:hypothetical protein
VLFALLGVVFAMVVVGVIASNLSTRARPATSRFDGPFELAFTAEGKILVEGHPKMYGDVSIHEDNYQITFHGFPRGTRWRFGEMQGSIDSDIYFIAKIQNVADGYGQVPVARIRNARLGPSGKLVIELPCGKTAGVALQPMEAWMSILDTLRRIENGPVVFTQDPPPRPDRRSVLRLEAMSFKLFGPALTVGDVDLIAVDRLLPEVRGERTCSGSTDSKGNELPSYRLLLKDTEVLVHDRRTGRVAHRRVFPGEDRCALFRSKANQDGTMVGYPPTREIEAWLNSLVLR